MLMYVSMGHTMWGWPLPGFFDGNHGAVGLTQLLLTGIILVINQRVFISGYKALWHRAPNMDTLVALGATAAFAYSTYALFAMTGIPFFWWSVGISLAVHAGIVIWLKTAPRLSPKKAICIALCVGMLDFLFVKIFPFPAQIMG